MFSKCSVSVNRCEPLALNECVVTKNEYRIPGPGTLQDGASVSLAFYLVILRPWLRSETEDDKRMHDLKHRF